MNKAHIFIFAIAVSLAFTNVGIAATETVTSTQVNKSVTYAKTLTAKRDAAQTKLQQLAKRTQAAWAEAKAYWQKAKADKNNRSKYNQLAQQKAAQAKTLGNQRDQALAEWKSLAKQTTAAWKESARLSTPAKPDKGAPAKPDKGDGSTQSVTLAWNSPTQRADGSSLSPSEIDGFRVYFGKDKDSLSALVDIQDGKTTQYTVPDLKSGSYYFAISTYDVNGKESGLSNAVQKRI